MSVQFAGQHGGSDGERPSNERAALSLQDMGAQEYRTAANEILISFQRISDKWDPQRYQLLKCYSYVLLDMHFTPAKSDLDTLKKIVKDRSDLRSIRALAVLVLGRCQWYLHRHDDAGDSFRDAIAFTEGVSAEEREHVFVEPDGDLELPMDVVLSSIAEEGRAYLDALISQDIVHESNPIRFVKTEELWDRHDGAPMPENGRQTKFCVGPNGVSISNADICKLLSVGGECCDCCGKTRAEAEMVCLDCCGRCKRVYFCSEECQRDQWLAGHREYCRKRGEIRVGDFVVIWGIRRRPELNGEVVQVDGPPPTQQGKWAVRKPGHDQAMLLAADKLYQLRPLK